MIVFLILFAAIAFALIYLWGAIVVFPALVVGLSFLYVWGAAPCWQFERYWREKYSQHPDESILIELGLAPKSRRQASAALFLVIVLLVFLLAWIFSTGEITKLGISGLAAAFAGTVGGLALHYIGPGSSRIRAFFKRKE